MAGAAWRNCLAAVALALLSGCALTYEARLRPGAGNEADVRRIMGEPYRKWPDPGGGTVWVFPTGPMGRHTYLVHIDSNGIVRGVQDVMNEDGFLRLRGGPIREDDVDRLFGPPFQKLTFPLSRTTAWDYRYSGSGGEPYVFSAIFDERGVLVGTMMQPEFFRGGAPQN